MPKPANGGTVPALRRGVRVVTDSVRRVPAVLFPEGVLLLNESAAAVVGRCDGRSDVAAIAADLGAAYAGVDVDSVASVVDDLLVRHVLTAADGPCATVRPGAPTFEPLDASANSPVPDPVPVGLLAELTYRCPLHCTYCSNPVDLAGYADELGTSEWRDAFDQARRLGVLQVHLSGGEPLLRRDLVELVAHIRGLGMYTNLVTSGAPMAGRRLAELVDAGLDHIQLSIQDSEALRADAVAGARTHDRKVAAAALIRRTGLPLTVNVVLHAANVDRLEDISEFAVRLGAERIELAHAQYYGWARRNRASLMPTSDQVERAATTMTAIRERYASDIEIVYVQPDYHGVRPKPCMNGWGSRQMVIAPNGDVLPCLAAGELPGLGVQNLREKSMADIWYRSPAFQAFRGTQWMKSPCRECPMREVDFGGCRCQAYALTGDAANADPVCELSPHHDLLVQLVRPPRTASARAVPRRVR